MIIIIFLAAIVLIAVFFVAVSTTNQRASKGKAGVAKTRFEGPRQGRAA